MNYTYYRDKIYYETYKGTWKNYRKNTNLHEKEYHSFKEVSSLYFGGISVEEIVSILKKHYPEKLI